jgi:hypothetical protein
MRSGQSAAVAFVIQNTGQTVWTPPQYSVRLTRSGRTALPQASVALNGPVPPGGVQALLFTVMCNGTGSINSYGAQIVGPNGNIGLPVTRTLICQP